MLFRKAKWGRASRILLGFFTKYPTSFKSCFVSVGWGSGCCGSYSRAVR